MVEIALDKYYRLHVPRRGPRLREAVEKLALVVHGGVRTVEILRLGSGDGPPAEANRPSPPVPYREQDPLPEPVVSLPGFRGQRKTGIDDRTARIPHGREVPHQRPSGGSPSELQAVHRRGGQPSVVQIGFSRRRRSLVHAPPVERMCFGDELQERRPRIGPEGGRHVDAVLCGEFLQSIAERDSEKVHHEGEHVSAGSAAETVVGLPGGGDMEGGGLLGVEGTEALVSGTAPGQRYIPAYDRYDVGGILDPGRRRFIEGRHYRRP